MRGKYITFLLVLIILILLVGVGLSIYYVINIVNDNNKQIEIYKEDERVEEQSKKIFDLSKRQYQMEVNGTQFYVLLNIDGKMNIMMQEDTTLKDKIKSFDSIAKKSIEADINDVVRVYEINIATIKQQDQEKNPDTIEYENDFTLVAITVDGNVYQLNKQILYDESVYKFTKIDSLKDIVSIHQIKKVKDIEITDAIAIDKNQNEILITEYIK